MNIIFKTLEINDFQSIGHAKIDLDEKGTVLIKGINNYEENTLSNGSGKSSIFEALYFSLFGRTTSGITNVTNRYSGSKSYKLVLEFSLDGVEYKITRDGTKVSILQNGEDISRRNKSDTDTFIRDDILKISPDIFLNIIYLAQGFKSRISALTAGGRKDQIEEIIGTAEITENFRLEMQSMKEKLNNELNETNNKISYNQGTLQQINTNINNYNLEIERIKKEKENQPSKEDLQKQIEDYNKLISNEKENQDKINKEITKIKDFNHSIEVEVLKIDNEIQSTKSEYQNKINQVVAKFSENTQNLAIENSNITSEYNTKILENNNQISILNTQNTNYNNQIIQNKASIETLKTSDTCPTCGRKFDNFDQTHLIQEIQKLIDNNLENDKLIKENNIKIDELQKLNKTLNNEKQEKIDKLNQRGIDLKNKEQEEEKQISDELNLKLDELIKQKEEKQKEIKDSSEQLNTLALSKSTVTDLEGKIALLNNTINNLKEESTENYEKLIKDCNTQIIKINEDNENLQKQISKLEEQIGVATHSISLISREFKNYLLKSAIEFLNNRLDHYSSLLFSNETDKIKFIQDGNKLDIYLGDALFESLSGGEKRKVDIAIMLVQKELANSMSNTYSNILILDEVFDGLDSKAIDIVTEILLTVSKDVNSMFVVSHKDTIIGHDGMIIVTKGKDRISTVLQQ